MSILLDREGNPFDNNYVYCPSCDYNTGSKRFLENVRKNYPDARIFDPCDYERSALAEKIFTDRIALLRNNLEAGNPATMPAAKFEISILESSTRDLVELDRKIRYLKDRMEVVGDPGDREWMNFECKKLTWMRAILRRQNH